jgi:geranylgeranyl pyrophosphate synthase
MDDDTLRRGRPTVHVRFGEPMAILAGDSLLTDAFELLATRIAEPAAARAIMAELARGAGAGGMVAGQAADMDLCELPAGLAGLEYIHLRKTAAMFVAAARMGGICGAATDEQLDALGAFARDLGLAFQVMDDLLDRTVSSEQLGKTAGKDAEAGKRTYPALLGIDGAEQAARRLTAAALDRLAPLGPAAQPLRDLTGLLLNRKS